MDKEYKEAKIFLLVPLYSLPLCVKYMIRPYQIFTCKLSALYILSPGFIPNAS